MYYQVKLTEHGKNKMVNICENIIVKDGIFWNTKAELTDMIECDLTHKLNNNEGIRIFTINKDNTITGNTEDIILKFNTDYEIFDFKTGIKIANNI